MISIKQKISAQSSVVSKLSPVILWLMLIFLPVMAGRLVFSSAIDMERQLNNSRIRQKLSIDFQRYNSALDPKSFLVSALNQTSFSTIVRGLYQGQNMQQEYKNHPFLGKLPDFSGPIDKEIEKVSRQFKTVTGSRPDLIFVFSPEAIDCGWQLRKPFTLPCDEKSFRRALRSGWKKISERLNFREKEIPRELQYITNEAPINQAMGIFDNLKTIFSIAQEHFSSRNNAILYSCLIPILDANGSFNNRFVLVGISGASLDPTFILKKTCKGFNQTGIKHSFGSSAHDLLPAFYDEGGQLSLIGEMPESFRKLAYKVKQNNNRRLVIKISSSNQVAESAFKSSMVSFLLLIYAMAATFIFAGISTGKFGNFQSIRRLVAAGLFAGILLPISGVIWLGICYLNTQKQLEAENMFDWMRLKIFAKDQAIKLQLSRNQLFRNIFSDSIAKLPVDKLKQLNQRTKYFEIECTERVDSKIDPQLENHIYVYDFFHPELEDVAGKINSRTKEVETVQPYFSSHAREALFQLGALNHLPSDRVRQILQKSQLTMGFLDKVIDKKIISKTFAEEKSSVINTMTSGRENITAVFWKNHAGKVSGLSLLQTNFSCWAGDFTAMLNAELIEQDYVHNGYRVFLGFYLTDPYKDRRLDYQLLNRKSLKGEKEAYNRQLAEALYLLSDTSSINNLDTSSPHLLSSAAVEDNGAFIMAIAVPVDSKDLVSDKALIAIVSLLAILCSLVLTKGLSWALLRTVPSFEVAINALSQQNYHWQLDLKSGDEFDQLAASFNRMAVKLHENAKISQLVSRNVMDAISSGTDHLLKPGGSRVDASILFADIRGFTSISENHRPEEVVDMLNDYFSLMAEIIEKNGGLIDKLIGDAIQAVFYAHENKNCAESAVKAGLEMRVALTDFNQERLNKGLFTIDNGVGICTGSVICGLIGSEQGMLDATIIGNLVNQAASFESLSKQGTSSKVIVDEATSKALPPFYRKQEMQLKLNDSTTVIELMQNQ